MDLIFKTKPWEHQQLAVEYLMEHPYAGLYTDMGTGKSKIIIDTIINRKFKGIVLIVCTNKGCEVWQKQFKIHSNLPSVYVCNLSGLSTTMRVQAIQQRLSEDDSRTSDSPLVVLINYEGVWRSQLAQLLLKHSSKIDCIICDESHRIKGANSKCSRFLAQLGKRVKNRYLVTGTPLAESPLDAYAQYRFLDPSIFGTSYARFKERYQNLDAQKSMRIGYPVLDAKQPYKNLDELHDKFFSIAFRIPSTVKLPKQKSYIRTFTLSNKETQVYQRMCKDHVIVSKTGEWYCEADNALTFQLRRRQIAGGFLSTVNDTNQKKIFRIGTTRQEVLMDVLASLPTTEPVVIFAQYTYDLRQIKSVCQAIGQSYSELSGRIDTEAAWQKGKTTVLGVQFSKGAESADFTRARYMIFYTMTNQLALYLQAKKRIHRPGQNKTCYYIHLEAKTIDNKDTIDRLVLEAVKRKKDIVTYILEQETNRCKD